MQAPLLSHTSPPPAAPLAAAAALALLVSAALLLLLRALRGLATYWSLDLPSPPEPSLLLGHAPIFMSNKQPLKLAAAEARLGPIFKARFLTTPMVVLTDPAAIVRLNR